MKSNIILAVILILAAGMRFYRIEAVPAGYTWDEASQIYNAWSLSLWHRDENARLFPLSFTSFGDYKPPLLIYSLSLLYTMFGLHEVYIRYLSAFFGVGVVWLTYLIGKEISKHTYSGLLAAAIMAILPWSIHFSRIGFEQQLALFLTTLGIYGLLKGLSRPRERILAVGAFGLSLYAFHTAKIFVPLWLLWFGILYEKKLKPNLKSWIGAMLLLLMLWAPLLYISFTTPANSRAATLIFFDNDGTLSPLLMVLKKFGLNVLSYLQPGFWLKGYDAVSLRNSVPGHGVLYGGVLGLFILGIVTILKKPTRQNIFLLGWLGIGLMPSLISWPAPHALRSLFAVVPVVLVGLTGFTTLLGLPKAKWIGLCLGIVVGIESMSYLHTYYGKYAQNSAKDFQYGYKQALAAAALYKANKTVITTRYGQPYIFVLLFKRITPQEYQFGALNAYEFREIKWPESQSNYVYVASPTEIPPNDPFVVETIMYPQTNEVIWVIAKT